MSQILETKEFACGAEAVADYYKRGFESQDGLSFEGRIMWHPDGREVWVRKRGFLHWIATVIERANP